MPICKPCLIKFPTLKKSTKNSGEQAGGGIRGGKQDSVFEGGNAFLDENYPELDRIYEATVEAVDGATN